MSPLLVHWRQPYTSGSACGNNDGDVTIRTEHVTCPACLPHTSGGADTLTLRDQFAMAALTGLLAHDYTYESHAAAAADAYLFADAMLAARGQR